jgi:hypothetical protein
MMASSSFLRPFLWVVHARAKISDDLECPALAGAVQFQHLLLALQIILLVVAADAGISHGAALRVRRSAEQFGLELGEVVAAVAARRVLGGQSARRLPAAQGRDGHAQRLGGFTYAN